MIKNSLARLIVVAWTLVFSLALLTVVSAQEGARPFLGINFVASDEGVQVADVQPGSPADEAGLQVGDIITAIDEQAVTADDIAEVVGGYAVGDMLTLTVSRDGESLDLEATLVERPADQMPARPERAERPERREAQQERPYLGIALNDEDGTVVIAQVADSSPAEAAGLEVGDVLLVINGEEVTDAPSAVEMIRALTPGDTVTLEVERDSETMIVDVVLGTQMMQERFSGVMPFDVVMYDRANESWLVVMLAEDSPLAAAGVEAGDEITAITVGGEAITVDDLRAMLEDAADDTEAELTIQRGDETLTVTAPLSALDTQMGFGQVPGKSGEGGQPFGGRMMGGNVRLGVAFVRLDADVAAENDLDITEGALVTEVQPDSPAEAAGLQVDDVITAVDGDVVDAKRDLRERLYAYEPGDTVTLDVLREGETLSLEATLEAGEMRFNFDGQPFGFNGELPFFFGPDGTFQFEIPEQPPVPDATPDMPTT